MVYIILKSNGIFVGTCATWPHVHSFSMRHYSGKKDTFIERRRRRSYYWAYETALPQIIIEHGCTCHKDEKLKILGIRVESDSANKKKSEKEYK